ADSTDRGLRRRREDGRPGDDVSQRHVHHPRLDGRLARHLGAGRPRQGRPAARLADPGPRLRRGDDAARRGRAREGRGVHRPGFRLLARLSIKGTAWVPLIGNALALAPGPTGIIHPSDSSWMDYALAVRL